MGSSSTKPDILNSPHLSESDGICPAWNMEVGISENIYKRFLQMASVQNNPPDSLKDIKDA